MPVNIASQVAQNNVGSRAKVHVCTAKMPPNCYTVVSRMGGGEGEGASAAYHPRGIRTDGVILDIKRQQGHQFAPKPSKQGKQNKNSTIALSNAIVDEWAVMVQTNGASVALLFVNGAHDIRGLHHKSTRAMEVFIPSNE